MIFFTEFLNNYKITVRFNLNVDSKITITIYTITGTFADNMIETTSGAAVAQANAIYVAAGTIVKNITAPQTVTYVNNISSYDISGEQHSGDGSTQAFTLAHSPSSVSSLGSKYIQYRHGFISQPSTAAQIKFTLTAGGDDEKIKSAHKMIIYAVVALVVAFLAQGIRFVIEELVRA